jgi:hypothetical protein
MWFNVNKSHPHVWGVNLCWRSWILGNTGSVRVDLDTWMISDGLTSVHIFVRSRHLGTCGWIIWQLNTFGDNCARTFVDFFRNLEQLVTKFVVLSTKLREHFTA